jgi:hypothetical protein
MRYHAVVTSLVLSGLCLSCLASCASSSTGSPSDSRIPIQSVGDLPRSDYRIGLSSMAVVADDDAFRELALRVARDRLRTPESHRFTDPKQEQRWYKSIARVYELIPDFDSAARYRAIAGDRGADASLGRIASAAEAEAIRAGGTRGEPAFDARFARSFREHLRRAPFGAIREELIGWRGAADVPNVDGIRAAAESITDPKLKASGGVASDSIVAEIMNWREAYRSLYWLRIVGPLAGELLEENAAREREGDLWTPRQIVLQPSDRLAEVRIGVWDTGVDPQTLGAAMWTNLAEAADGLDNDSNGFVDDLHGIALTGLGSPRPGTMRPLGTLGSRYEAILRHVIAQADIARGVENPGTVAFKRAVREMSVDARVAFDEERSRVADYVHGTHVASIAVAGNPFARVVAVAHGYPDDAEDSRPPSLETATAVASSSTTAIEYFRRQGVRVVTMSWLTSPRVLEAEMEQAGVGTTAAERGKLAREWFALHRTRLQEAIRNAPEILFVCGSGNFSDDVDFSEYIPAGLELPNLVTVGAVDALDRPTSFTTTGRGVRLYANGNNIAGLVPGGATAVFSGTSAAVPQVANAAAKLLAYDPTLTPPQIIRILAETGRPVEGVPGANAIDPRKAVQRLRTAR